jgi:hypothetical protein
MCAYYQIDYENKTRLSYLTKRVDCLDDLDVDGKRIMLIRDPVAVSSGHVDINLICIKMKISYQISEFNRGKIF